MRPHPLAWLLLLLLLLLLLAPASAWAGPDSDTAPRAPRSAEETAAETAQSRLERQGDAAFRARSLAAAEQLYNSAMQGGQTATLLLKLSDVAFLRGDLATEKTLREKIFGSLAPRR